MWLAKRARVFQTVKVGFGKKNDALYLGGGDTASGAVWDGSDVQKPSNVDVIWW